MTGDQVPWIDEATVDIPSRQNNDPQYLSSYRAFDVSGGSRTVTVHANVGGVDAPLDGALSGDLFSAFWKEWSGTFPPPLTSPAGQTSVVSCTVTNAHVGHFCLLLKRANGGGVFLHFDVEDP